MVVRIKDSAERDLLDGFWFYEDQAPGTGRLRRGCISSVMVFISGPARRFPHGFYYRISSETVKVYAVLDCRRNPRWIHRQLKDR